MPGPAMAEAYLSEAAAADLEAIYLHGFVRFGEMQAEAYAESLHRTLSLLADNPGLGPACDDVRPGYRRFRYHTHVIFYRVVGQTVRVIRVLHSAMDVARHV
jgi:toxin ParE1/3/4